MSIYKLLKMERRDMLEQLYNEMTVNITITNGITERKVDFSAVSPLPGISMITWVDTPLTERS